MKTLEKFLLLCLIRPWLQHHHGFVKQRGVGVEDAILCLLLRVHSHLDDKLNWIGEDFVWWTGSPYTWLMSHSVCLKNTVVSSTGVPQGIVLAPLRFSLYATEIGGGIFCLVPHWLLNTFKIELVIDFKRSMDVLQFVISRVLTLWCSGWPTHQEEHTQTG